MNTLTTLTQPMAAAVPVPARNVSLRTSCKQIGFGWYLDFHQEHEVRRHLGNAVGRYGVATKFILGPKGIRNCVSFLINRVHVS